MISTNYPYFSLTPLANLEKDQLILKEIQTYNYDQVKNYLLNKFQSLNQEQKEFFISFILSNDFNDFNFLEQAVKKSDFDVLELLHTIKSDVFLCYENSLNYSLYSLAEQKEMFFFLQYRGAILFECKKDDSDRVNFIKKLTEKFDFDSIVKIILPFFTFNTTFWNHLTPKNKIFLLSHPDFSLEEISSPKKIAQSKYFKKLIEEYEFGYNIDYSHEGLILKSELKDMFLNLVESVSLSDTEEIKIFLINILNIKINLLYQGTQLFNHMQSLCKTIAPHVMTIQDLFGWAFESVEDFNYLMQFAQNLYTYNLLEKKWPRLDKKHVEIINRKIDSEGFGWIDGHVFDEFFKFLNEYKVKIDFKDLKENRNIFFFLYDFYIIGANTFIEFLTKYSDINLKDNYGNNVLDYFCKKNIISGIKYYSLDVIKVLINKNLKLSVSDPQLENVFSITDKAFYQVLIFFMFNLNKIELKKIFKQLKQEEISNLLEITEKNPELHTLISSSQKEKIPLFDRLINLNFLEKNQKEIPNTEKEIFISLKEFSKEKRLRIKQIVNNLNYPLNSNSFDLIKEKPLASLSLEIILNSELNILEYTNLIKSLTPNETLFILKYLFKNPLKMGRVVEKLLQEKEIYVCKSGGSFKHTFGLFSEPLLTKLAEKYRLEELASFDPYILKPLSNIQPLKKLTIHGKIVKILGRTIYFKPFGDKSDTLEALKFCNQEESLKKFCEEDRVTRFYRDNKKSFKSEFHRPNSIIAARTVEFFPPNKDFKIPKKLENSYIFHYSADKKSINYWHQLPEKQFNKTRKIFLHDTAVQVKNGILPDMAPLFHNEQDDRVYIPIPDQYIDPYEICRGSGRLDKGFKGIEYDNIRENRIVDLADAVSIKELMLNMDFENPIGALAYIISRIILVDTLNVCYHRLKMGKIDWEDKALNQELADYLLEGFSLTLKHFTGYSLKKCHHFLRDSNIRWNLLAAQISFWITHDQEKNLKYLAENRLPEELYDPKIVTKFSSSKSKNFIPEKGLSMDGEHIDFGTYNGPLLWTEFEKALTITQVMALGIGLINKKFKATLLSTEKD